MKNKINRLLVALDGSDQASVVVNYVGEIFPPETTHVVLFHVISEVPELLWDVEKNAEQHFQIHSVKAWMTEQKKMIGEFLNQSKQRLVEKGFSAEHVDIVVQSRKKGIARDIHDFSREGFHALVLGRTGVSRLKDLFVGSVASKLLGKVSDIPLIVVGKQIRPGGILIAYDQSEDADKAVIAVGQFVGGDSHNITVLHVIRSLNILYLNEIQRHYPIDELEWTEKHRETIEPELDRAISTLEEAGIQTNRISKKILTDQISRAGAVIQEARDGNYSTIVVGRRGLSIVEEFLLGRVGKKIFQMANDMTVWVVA
ncbi:MAG: universal stress protein [Proteobacteria bacterium]|nr:universal stress protein [Pseudomonadota bacterium]